MSPFWLGSRDALFAQLEVGPEGLTAAEAKHRRARFGANRIDQRRHRPWPIELIRRLLNPLVAMLLAAAAVAGATGDVASFLIIALVVLLSTGFDLLQEHRANATALALRSSIALTVEVRRDGTFVTLPTAELVPGDVVRLAAGDLVPADGLLLDANSLQVNEAPLTGEAYPVRKRIGTAEGQQPADAFNALFSGTAVVAGSATMLVVDTGPRTRFGQIAGALGADQPPTAFERGIHRLGLLIVRLTIFLVLFVLLAHIALKRPPLESFLFAMALAVGLTPELLPMIITVALARGAERLAARRVVVKRLSAIHDLGQMDILCTDKTGTLTEARISVIGHPGPDGADDERVLALAAVNARFETGLKSPLDKALLVHVAGHALDGWTKLDELPFDFQRRCVSVLAQEGSERIEIIKGAPEAVLALSSQARARDDAIAPLDEALRQRLAGFAADRARQGSRLLGVAFRPMTGATHLDPAGERNFIFAGYCTFVDPPKASATSAIARLAGAGIRVKIISGDAAEVVQHLVGELGLPVRGLLTGDQIAQLSDAGLAARAAHVDLFARVTPDQKTRIVRALQQRGHTVGFIGDGINDAPAIRAADAGISVDGAADVAREAADMIMLEGDLNVLADGVAEGRRTYANILKYIRMGTSSNFGNMLTMAIASLWIPFLPLTPVQVLLNNLLYDVSQVGLPFDSADAADLARPHPWDMHAILRFTLVMGLLSSLFDFATFALLLGPLHATIGQFRSGWFVESMATQILVVLVIRTAGPAWGSRPEKMLVASGAIALLIAATLPLSPAARLLGFGTLPVLTGAATAGIVLAYLAAAEMLKGYAMRCDPAGPAGGGSTSAPPARDGQRKGGRPGGSRLVPDGLQAEALMTILSCTRVTPGAPQAACSAICRSCQPFTRPLSVTSLPLV